MHAATKLADSTKFSQSEWMFMDLTILTNFCHFLYFLHIWTYLTSSLFNIFCFRQKEPTEDENEGDKRQSSDWSWTKTFPPVHLKENWYYFTKELLNLHRYFACFLFFFTWSWCLVVNAICPKGGVKMNTRLKNLKKKQEIWGEFFTMWKLWHCFFSLEIKESHWPFYFPKIWFSILPTSCHNFSLNW